MSRLLRAASAFLGGRRGSHHTGYHAGGHRRSGGIGGILRRFLR